MLETPANRRAHTRPVQLTEAESALIYDEMLQSGRIIQVTSNGVRVFDRSGVFIRDEVVKAKLVFPRIDYTPPLERMLDRFMEKDEAIVEKVRVELYSSVYRPIKKSLDHLVHDPRIFFSDSSAFGQVRAELGKVIDRMDLLTLGLLNDILAKSELDFRRHIEAGAYSGLVGSVIFGDYRRKISDKKVVEDLVLMGMVLQLGPELERSKSFQELRRTSKRLYDVKTIIEEVRTNPDEPTNILSEILATSLKYVEALDRDPERDPLSALVTLLGSSGEKHAVAVAALVQKYSINDYMINYLRRDEAFRRTLHENEDRFERTLQQRLERETVPAATKLANLFVRQLRLKRTMTVGSDAMHALDEFVGTLLPIKAAAAELLERLAGAESPDAVRLKGATEQMLETVEACVEFHAQHTDPANWPHLENVPGAAYLLAFRKRPEIEYRVQRAVRSIQRCRDQAAGLVGVSRESTLRKASEQFEQHAAAVDRFRATMPPQPFDIALVLQSAGRPFTDGYAFRLLVEAPDEPTTVNIDPIGFEELAYGVLERIADAFQAAAESLVNTDGTGSELPCVHVATSVDGASCVVEIRGPAGPSADALAGLETQLQAVSPGAALTVICREDSAAAVQFVLPLAELVEADAL
jgi:hypothetical protein